MVKLRVSKIIISPETIGLFKSDKSSIDLEQIDMPEGWRLRRNVIDNKPAVLRSTEPIEKYVVTLHNARQGFTNTAFNTIGSYTKFRISGEDMICNIRPITERTNKYPVNCKFPRQRTADECLDFNVGQLRNICGERNIRGMSRAIKEELIEQCCAGSHDFSSIEHD